MAGDWLKIEASTPDKPEVFEIATQCAISPAEAFGRLFLLWRWFDQHTESGNAANVTWAYLNHIAGVAKFAEAMHAVGWLKGGEDGKAGVTLPNFARHNGKTAKSRALTSRRVATHKQRSANDTVTPPALPREEKRREEVKTKPLIAALSFPDGVAESDWQAFTEHRRKLRKPMTPKAEQLAVAKLHELVRQGYDATKLLNRAIESGWLTFYAHDDCRAGSAPGRTVELGCCPCGAQATIKVGGKPRCRNHVRGLEVVA